MKTRIGALLILTGLLAGAVILVPQAAAEPAGSCFSLLDLAGELISPGVIAPGETLTNTHRVTNNSNRAKSISVILKVKAPESDEFRPEAVKEITLSKCSSGNVSFFVTKEEPGTYAVELAGRTGSFEVAGEAPATATKSPAAVKPASLFLVPRLFVSPDQASPGETIDIVALLRNDGGDIGESEVVFKVNGAVQSTSTIRVPGNSEVEVPFRFAADALGDYAVEIEASSGEEVKTLKGSFVVIEPVQQPTSEASTKGRLAACTATHE